MIMSLAVNVMILQRPSIYYSQRKFKMHTYEAQFSGNGPLNL